MRLRLLKNLAGPWGGGFKGEILHSPVPLPEELARELVRKGHAVQLPEAATSTPQAQTAPTPPSAAPQS